MKTMDKMLAVIFVTFVIFTLIMLVTFWVCGSIPDTLCSCVFAVLGDECGAMAWIRTAKERYRERRFEKEDREYYENNNRKE